MDVEPAKFHVGAHDPHLASGGHLTLYTILRTHNPAASYSHFNYTDVQTYTSNL
jgi:hypothetical protein